MSDPKSPNQPEEMDKAEQYSVFLNFKDRDAVDLASEEETIDLNRFQSAAMVKQLSSNPEKYIMLRNAGYLEEDIPSWVARPPPGSMEKIVNMKPQAESVESTATPRENAPASGASTATPASGATASATTASGATPSAPVRTPTHLVVSQRESDAPDAEAHTRTKGRTYGDYVEDMLEGRTPSEAPTKLGLMSGAPARDRFEFYGDGRDLAMAVSMTFDHLVPKRRFQKIDARDFVANPYKYAKYGYWVTKDVES